MLSRSGVRGAGPLLTRQVKAHPELGRRAEHSPHTPLGRNKGKGEKRGGRGTCEGPISVGWWLCSQRETEALEPPTESARTGHKERA